MTLVNFMEKYESKYGLNVEIWAHIFQIFASSFKDFGLVLTPELNPELNRLAFLLFA